MRCNDCSDLTIYIDRALLSSSADTNSVDLEEADDRSLTNHVMLKVKAPSGNKISVTPKEQLNKEHYKFKLSAFKPER